MKSAWFKIVLAFLHTLKAFICLILIFTGDEIIKFPLHLHAVAFNKNRRDHPHNIRFHGKNISKISESSSKME